MATQRTYRRMKGQKGGNELEMVGPTMTSPLASKCDKTNLYLPEDEEECCRYWYQADNESYSCGLQSSMMGNVHGGKPIRVLWSETKKVVP